MGEAGEDAEVFKNLFGGFSGSLSLFTNNPYQRGNIADAAGAPASLSANEKGVSNDPLTKGKKLAGEEESKKAPTEPVSEEKKLKKKKKKRTGTAAENDDGASDLNGQSQDVTEKSVIDEGVKLTKKKKDVVDNDAGGLNVSVENAPSNARLKDLNKEKLKRTKRKVVEEEIQEDFEKKFRGSDGKKAKSEASGQQVHSEDPEIDIILHESLQEDNKKQTKRKLDDEDDGPPVPARKKKKTKKEIEVEDEKLLRTVFVGNLPTAVKKKQIIREFSQFGKVASARLRSVALIDTKLPRKAAVITGQLNEKRSSQNAYVVFEEVESAKAALAHNMAEFQGKHIRVDMATAPRKVSNPGVVNESEFDRTRSLFVGNVPFDVEDEDLYKAFATDKPEMAVEAIRVPRDPQTSISKGFGFVLFKTKAGANAALQKKSTKLGERYLRVVRMGSQQRVKSLSRPSSQDNGRSKTSTGGSRRASEGGVTAATAKKGPLPWEGARSAKLDGKPGKVTAARHDSKHTPKGATTKTTDPAPKVRLTKRPAVLARKQAALFKAGMGPAPPKNAGSKRKSQKGRQGGGKAKKKAK